MSELKSVFKRGYKVMKKKDEEIEEKKKSNISRFFMKPEEEKTVIFLDDDPLVVEEHQVWEDKRPQYFTCLKMWSEPCPLCKRKHKASTVGYYSVICRTPYEDSKGKVHKNEKMLFGTKVTASRKMRRLSKEHEGLIGVEFKIYRDSKNDPTTGSDFKFIKRYEIDYLISKGLDATPCDYDAVFAPKNIEEYEEVEFTEYGKGKNKP